MKRIAIACVTSLAATTLVVSQASARDEIGSAQVAADAINLFLDVCANDEPISVRQSRLEEANWERRVPPSESLKNATDHVSREAYLKVVGNKFIYARPDRQETVFLSALEAGMEDINGCFVETGIIDEAALGTQFAIILGDAEWEPYFHWPNISGTNHDLVPIKGPSEVSVAKGYRLQLKINRPKQTEQIPD